MNIVFKSFFILCCSLSFCFAGVGDDFIQDFERNANTLKQIKEKIENLTENKHKEYFCNSEGGVDQFNKAHLLFKFSEEQTRTLLQAQIGYSEEDAGKIGARSFLIYCKQLPLIKNLRDEKVLAQPHSPYFTDLEQCIEAVNFYSKYFTRAEECLSSFLRIEPHQKIEIRSDNARIKWYGVYLHKYDWTIDQRKQARNILNRVNQVNPDVLKLPEKYKYGLKNILSLTKRKLESFLESKVNATALKEKPVDLANSGEVAINLSSLANNLNALDYALSVVESAPLNFRFSDGPNQIVLSDEERKQSQALLDKFLEQKARVSLAKASAPLRPAGQLKKGKTQSKKSKKMGLTQAKPKTAELKTPIILPTTADESLSSQAFASCSKDLEESSSPSFVTGLDEKLMSDPSLSTKSEPSSSTDPVLNQHAVGNEDLHLFAKEWLKDIIKVSQSKNEAFGIFEKASRLSSMLAKNAELLEQTLEATAGLARRMQRLEKSSLTKSLSYIIPQRCEADFLHFTETPLCYLNDMRFGSVNTLFEALGIKINNSMAGSRIKFSFKGNTMCMHLHDKHNGVLDGGRISSLRKFLIDCGFIYNEMQSTPIQKPSGRRARR